MASFFLFLRLLFLLLSFENNATKDGVKPSPVKENISLKAINDILRQNFYEGSGGIITSI